ncbi:hypothetical protein SAY87_023227 [Trapa incisa]|uniref:Uncharacterized protein n=1 Tax=Trapa incisa TaxID=236973 RepID=A0AAN7Q5H8_9MYRT|nr:hypothetical protein SAY87_023227 [Trapa incisa]
MDSRSSIEIILSAVNQSPLALSCKHVDLKCSYYAADLEGVRAGAKAAAVAAAVSAVPTVSCSDCKDLKHYMSIILVRMLSLINSDNRVACFADALRFSFQLVAVRVIPWAKAHINYTGQTLIISAGIISFCL